MGKWLDRLAALDDAGEEKNFPSPFQSYCQNRQKPVLSVLAGGQEGGTPEISVESAAAALPHPHGWGWGNAEIRRFLARRARLQRWGWPADQAEAVADRLTCRDVAGDDDRVSCTDCRYYRPGRCGNHQSAGLHSAEMSRDLAGLLQRCPGFQSEE